MRMWKDKLKPPPPQGKRKALLYCFWYGDYGSDILSFQSPHGKVSLPRKH